jgi:hypothetical protein
MSATVMREDDQRPRPGPRHGIAHSHLASRCVASRDLEVVPGSCRNILTCMLRGRGIPDLTREQAVPSGVKRLGCPHANRESAPDKWIVFVRPRRGLSVGILPGSLEVFACRHDTHSRPPGVVPGPAPGFR